MEIKNSAKTIVLLLTALILSATSRSQEACICNETCPPPPYTKCSEGWSSNNRITIPVYIQKLDRACYIEIQYCCRVRPIVYPHCVPFVPAPLTASCETAITCIKIPKECVVEVAANPGPVTDAVVRKQIYQGILDYFICNNICGHQLPYPGQQPYEWVFSMPTCMRYLKTGNPMAPYCLTSCGTKYCVYAFKVMESPTQGKTVRCLNTTITQWSSTIPGVCDVFANGCVEDACDETYRPNCPSWEFM